MARPTWRWDAGARAARQALAPFVVECYADTGVDLTDRLDSDCKLLRLALIYAELSTLVDTTTATAGRGVLNRESGRSAAEARQLNSQVNELLYLTGAEIRCRLQKLATNRT